MFVPTHSLGTAGSILDCQDNFYISHITLLCQQRLQEIEVSLSKLVLHYLKLKIKLLLLKGAHQNVLTEKKDSLT